MFNLMVSSHIDTDWRAGKSVILYERILQYTDSDITKQFQRDDKILFDDLKVLPCLFCEEGREEQLAYVGKIEQLRFIGREKVILEVEIDKKVPPLPNRMLYENRAELNIDYKFEFSTNHWAVKDVDLYRFLMHNVRPRRQRPTVFKIDEYENIEPTLISAMMPFNAEFDLVYEAIQQASSNVGLSCKRADDFWEEDAVINDVAGLIDRSRIVVCDCSGRNPNVFYEAGIAHTLGREVILITQNEQDIPFDLNHIHYIRYLNNTEGLADLRKHLEERIQTLLGKS